MAKITVEKAEISVIQISEEDFISLTDIAHSQMEEHIIIKWLSLKSTIEYIGEWEALFNPNFNYTEFGTIKNTAGSNNFVLSVKQWIEKTGAIGITAKAGRYGGTYAHKDIAFHFGMWISPRFQLLLVKEFQRLKDAEQQQIGWSAKRELAKGLFFYLTTNQTNHTNLYFDNSLLFVLVRGCSWWKQNNNPAFNYGEFAANRNKYREGNY